MPHQTSSITSLATDAKKRVISLLIAQTLVWTEKPKEQARQKASKRATILSQETFKKSLKRMAGQAITGTEIIQGTIIKSRSKRKPESPKSANNAGCKEDIQRTQRVGL